MSGDELPPRKKRKRKPIKVMALNLAPLIDINANLLFFMIIANSVQEDRLQAGKNIELAESVTSTAEAGDLVSLVVGLNEISVNELVVKIEVKNGLIADAELDPKDKDKIIKLHTTLTERFQDLIRKGAQPGAADDDDSKLPVVLIQADRKLPYVTVQRIMQTCGMAGFTKFRFAAKGK
jgi:biopolymer transport protein ExbD